MTISSYENRTYSSTLEGTNPPPVAGVALALSYIEPRCGDEIDRQVSSQTLKSLFQCENTSNVSCIWLKQYGRFHRQISAYAWRISLSIMLVDMGIVRSLWIELNGSIKAVSPTYRCATYSRHESELPLCGRTDFTKPEKSSLIFINSIAKKNWRFWRKNWD